jgi:hypothetical protein
LDIDRLIEPVGFIEPLARFDAGPLAEYGATWISRDGSNQKEDHHDNPDQNRDGEQDSSGYVREHSGFWRVDERGDA